MAAPVITSPTGSFVCVTTNSVNLTLGATINAGDIIILVVHYANTTGTVPTSFTWPAGFVDVFPELPLKTAAGVSRGLCGVAWKRAVGNEDGTVVSTTHAGATGNASVFCGSHILVTGCAATGDPFDTPVTNNPNHTTTIDWPAITPSGDERSLLTGFCNTDNNANATTPTNWTALVSGNNSTGQDAANDLDKRENVTAAGGPYDPANQTIANSNAAGWATFQIAFKPPPVPIISQAQYRWVNDDGSESGATFAAALNTALGTLNDGVRKRLRITIDETGSADIATQVWKLQCRVGAGAWQDVNASATICRPSASSNVADDAVTTQRISSGLGTFVAGRFDEVDGSQSTVDLAADGVTEHEWSIALYGAGEAISPGDTIEFRVVYGSSGLLNTYAVTPSLTVGAVPRRAQVTWAELEVPAAAGAVDYTDSGTALLKFTVSATEEHTTFDTGTAALVLTPSGTDIYGRETVDADTANLRFTPSATEEHTTFDVGTVLLDLQPAGTEEKQQYDVGTVLLDLQPAGTEGQHYTDANTISLVLQPSGTEIYGRETIDAATGLVTFTPTGIEAAQFADSATVKLNFNPTGTDDHTTFDSGTAAVLFTPFAAEAAQFVDVATALVVFTPSGTEEKQQYDTNTALIAFSPSGTDIAQFIDANTVPLTLTPSGTDEYIPLAGVTYTDSATADLRFTPTTLDIAQFIDATTAQILFTPSATEERQMYDAATASLTLSPAASEIQQSVDSDTIRLSFTPTGTDERSYFDAATGSIRFTPSATEAAQFVDSSIVSLLFGPSGSDVPVYADSNTIPLALVPSGTDSMSGVTVDADTTLLALVPSATDIAGLLDTATVPLALQPSGQDLPVYADSATTTLVFTPSGVDTLSNTYLDSATIPLNLRPSATDILIGVDTATPVVVLTPSGVEGFGGNVDEGLIYLKLTPSVYAEILYLFDTLLVATLSTRWNAVTQQNWAASMTQQWAASISSRLWAASLQSSHWAATLNRRWNDTFAGTGPGKLIFYAFDFLLAGTLKNRWSGAAEQSWSATMVSRWSAIVLNRSWSGAMANRTWVADLARRWNPKYIGRGKD